MTTTYNVSQADVVLPEESVIRSKAMRHVLAIRLSQMKPTPPSRLGGLKMLSWVLHEMFSGTVREQDGRPFSLSYGLVDAVYDEFGGGADGRWHTDALKWATNWPQRRLQHRHLVRMKLWYIFFAVVGQPLDIEAHRHCEVCKGRY